MKKAVEILKIRNLKITTDQTKIVHGLSLNIKQGEFHVVMGPNGSGKSTLTLGLMGSPQYHISADLLQIGKKDLLKSTPEERAKAGLLLAFQNPLTIPGVTISNLLRTASKELHKDAFSALEFHNQLKSYADTLNLPHEFLQRSLNDGFSGGEKKKVEILQLLALRPKFAMLDEIDTGLDVDALKLVARGINQLQKQGAGILLITHYQRILNYVKPQFVHILKKGQFVAEGGMELVAKIEKDGYAAI